MMMIMYHTDTIVKVVPPLSDEYYKKRHLLCMYCITIYCQIANIISPVGIVVKLNRCCSNISNISAGKT